VSGIPGNHGSRKDLVQGNILHGFRNRYTDIGRINFSCETQPVFSDVAIVYDPGAPVEKQGRAGRSKGDLTLEIKEGAEHKQIFLGDFTSGLTLNGSIDPDTVKIY